VWFQKISIPPPRRELEIPRGWGVKGPGNSEVEGVERSIWFPDALSIQYDFKNPFLPTK